MKRSLSRQFLATAGMLCLIGLLSLLARDASAADTELKPVSSLTPAAAKPVVASLAVASSTTSSFAVASPGASSTPSSAQGALSSSPVEPISANPGASNIIAGTGLLGHLMGLDNLPGVRLGGLWIGNADYLFTGGVKPRTWSSNSLLLLNLNIDADALVGIPGGSLDAELLQFNGENANGKAGVVVGYDGLTGPKPRSRTELYELWWRQSLFANKLVIRVGKTAPTSDFGNVSKAVPSADAGLQSLPSRDLSIPPSSKTRH
jgi:porin